MIDIRGYTIDKVPIYSGGDTMVIGAVRDADKKNVAIKLLKNEHPSPDAIARFKHEYEVAKLCAGNTDIVQVYDLKKYGTSYAIIMEFIRDPTLNEVLKQKNKIDLYNFLKLSLEMTEALSHIHQNGIIHKDINPFNIMCDFDNKQVKIIDFGLSATLPREFAEIVGANVLEGSLEYLSPEQTGRMSRGIDYRTDYYSLGITFYQMLTGKLPFDSKDPMDLVHCHIAVIPKEPHSIDPNIPEVVSAIIMKLLLKNAEDRYQNVNGLMEDLKKCYTQLEHTGNIQPFTLGANDVFSRFQIPEKMYGREHEISSLLDAYNRVVQGSVELLLVTGYSGIGKSSLVHEVNKVILQKHGHFISGKFDQFKRNIPYSAVIQAIDGFVQQLLTESEDQVAVFNKRILAAVGDNGKVITDVVPMLLSVIGEQPAVADLGPMETKNRFDYLFQMFIQSLASPDHPLVIFLDDLQWSDLPSLKIMETLLTSSDCQSLLIIGAYRSNEINAAHPLMMSLNEMRQQDVPCEIIELGPLRLEHVIELLIDTLHQDYSKVHPLACLCLEKTGGNPFFLINLLIALHQEYLIYFNVINNQWEWSLDKIGDKNISDNVAELVVGQLSKLSSDTQRTLQYASCIGNKFTLDLLSSICKKDPATVFEELQISLHENYIICYGESYKTKLYYFAHDRIQQAAHSMINDNDKVRVNIELARLILQNAEDGKLDEVIFDIANHYNSGVEYGMPDFIQSEEKRKISEVNHMASQVAKKNGAFEEAMKYIIVAIQCRAEASWDSDYDFLFALYSDAAEIAFLSEKPNLTEEYIKICFEYAKTAPDELKVIIIQLKALSLQRNFEELIKLAIKTVRRFGIWAPYSPQKIYILFVIIKTKILLKNKRNIDLLNLPSMADPVYIALVRVMLLAVYAVNFTAPEMLPIIINIVIKLSLKYGNTHGSDFAYTLYAAIICGLLKDNDGRLQFSKLSFAIMDKINDTEYRPKIHYLQYMFINNWHEHIRNSLIKLEENVEYGLRNGDPEFAWASICSYGLNAFFSGIPVKNLLEKIIEYKLRADKTKGALIASIHLSVQMNVLLMLTLNRNKNIISILNEYNEEKITSVAVNKNMPAVLFALYLYKIIYNVIFDRVDKGVLKFIAECDLYAKNVFFTPPFPEYTFYKSLSFLLLYKLEKSKYEKIQIKMAVCKLQKQRKQWSEHCPSNYLHQYFLVEAEYAWIIDENSEKAIELYDRAISGAHENEFTNHEALANELAAKFYLTDGKKKIASVYMEEARHCYRVWGADTKVAQLEEKYPELLKKMSSDLRGISGPVMRSSVSSHMSSQGMSYDLDISTILKSSKIISETLELSELLKDLMRIVMENAGAQKSYLLLPKDGKYYIEAECHSMTEKVDMLHSIVLNDDIIPIGIINYVTRTKEPVVLNKSIDSAQFLKDPYIIKYNPKSVLCMPLLNKGIFSGILYMENNLSEGAFTKDRIRVLNLLSSQIAIAINNARLYNHTMDIYKKLTELNKSYERFVPHNFLSILGKKTIMDVKLGDRIEKNMSVLFLNIKNFPLISSFMTPQENFNFINEFLSLMVPVIQKYNGVIDKYIGNGIMAFYPNDADDAVQCALDMQRTLLNYNADRPKKLAPILIGIGINTGPLMLGTVGEVNRLNVTVISDAVNIAARVEHLTNKYKVGIIITEDTYKKIKNPARYNIKMLDAHILVKGKAKEIVIYKVE